MFRSDAGRPVYGGGGITPDVIVQDDTLLTAEQVLLKALAPKASEVETTLRDFALELSRKAPAGFQPEPTWNSELKRRIESRGVEIDDAQWQAGGRYITQRLEYFVTRYAQGDSAATRRRLKYDAPLRKALDMMNKGQTQRDLFAMVASAPITAKPGSPAPKNAGAAVPPR